MENTVTLKLERYHELLTYEEKANEPRVHTIYIKHRMFQNERVETDDDAVKSLAEELAEIKNKADEKDAEIEKLKSQLEKELKKEKNFFKYIKLFLLKRLSNY